MDILTVSAIGVATASLIGNIELHKRAFDWRGAAEIEGAMVSKLELALAAARAEREDYKARLALAEAEARHFKSKLPSDLKERAKVQKRGPGGKFIRQAA